MHPVEVLWLLAWFVVVIAAALKTNHRDPKTILVAILVFYVAPLLLVFVLNGFTLRGFLTSGGSDDWFLDWVPRW